MGTLCSHPDTLRVHPSSRPGTPPRLGRRLAPSPEKRLETPKGPLETFAVPSSGVLESTPASAELAATYAIQCPLCFSYHREGFRASCCGHCICGSCAMRHARTKKGRFSKVDGPPKGKLEYGCPYCGSKPFFYSPVDAKFPSLRSYKDSPAPDPASAGSDERSTPHATSPRISPSPRLLEFGEVEGVAAMGSSRRRTSDIASSSLLRNQAIQEEVEIEAGEGIAGGGLRGGLPPLAP